MGALADCEAIVDSLLGQRVNSITTLAFAVAAFVVWRWSTRVWIALGLLLTGIGSFFFHGPMPSWSQLAHDVTLWFLVAVAVGAIIRDLMRSREWRPLVGPLALLTVVAVIGRLGATGNPLCDPTSIWQPHGLWHIGAAVAAAWWAVTTAPKNL